VAVGDHDILIGHVVRAQCGNGEPLVFFWAASTGSLGK
jgi:flavin reductase (DIM6/NTAB) family NADH-FMN oxidoreductase RutF